jgi:hypothetical protein
MDNSPEQEFIDSIQVVAGNPTEEELAAVIAVLAETYRDQGSVPARSTWAKNSSRLRTQIVAGNGQWGSSYKAGL